MRIPKLKLKIIIEKWKKLPRILGEHYFLTFLFLILLALILGGVIFYKYGILVKKTEPEVFEKPFHFNEKACQEILKIWENRQMKFEQTEIKEYPDLFRSQ